MRCKYYNIWNTVNQNVCWQCLKTNDMLPGVGCNGNCMACVNNKPIEYYTEYSYSNKRSTIANIKTFFNKIINNLYKCPECPKKR